MIERTRYEASPLKDRFILLATHVGGLLDMLVFIASLGFATSTFRAWALFSAPWVDEEDRT